MMPYISICDYCLSHNFFTVSHCSRATGKHKTEIQLQWEQEEISDKGKNRKYNNSAEYNRLKATLAAKTKSKSVFFLNKDI